MSRWRTLRFQNFLFGILVLFYGNAVTLPHKLKDPFFIFSDHTIVQHYAQCVDVCFNFYFIFHARMLLVGNVEEAPHFFQFGDLFLIQNPVKQHLIQYLAVHQQSSYGFFGGFNGSFSWGYFFRWRNRKRLGDNLLRGGRSDGFRNGPCVGVH